MLCTWHHIIILLSYLCSINIYSQSSARFSNILRTIRIIYVIYVALELSSVRSWRDTSVVNILTKLESCEATVTYFYNLAQVYFCSRLRRFSIQLELIFGTHNDYMDLHNGSMCMNTIQFHNCTTSCFVENSLFSFFILFCTFLLKNLSYMYRVCNILKSLFASVNYKITADDLLISSCRQLLHKLNK